LLATLMLRVMPSGISLRVPDMSLNMSLLAVSDETGVGRRNPWIWA
jgi:hypothetical protein